MLANLSQELPKDLAVWAAVHHATCTKEAFVAAARARIWDRNYHPDLNRMGCSTPRHTYTSGDLLSTSLSTFYKALLIGLIRDGRPTSYIVCYLAPWKVHCLGYVGAVEDVLPLSGRLQHGIRQWNS